MPDDQDYRWLAWLLEHPERWTGDDLSAAQSMLANQRRAFESLHARDVAGRASAVELIDRLGVAIRSHRDARGGSSGS